MNGAPGFFAHGGCCRAGPVQKRAGPTGADAASGGGEGRREMVGKYVSVYMYVYMCVCI